MENILSNYSYVVDLLNPFLLVFLIGHAFKTIISNTIDWSNSENKCDLSEKIKNLHKMHPLMKKFLSASKINKCIKYDEEHGKFSDFVSNIQSPFSSIFLLLGIVPAYLHFIINYFPNLSTTCHYIIFAVSISLIKYIIDIPFEYYSTFKIEGRWNFNKETNTIFFLDKIKSFIIGSIIMSVLITLLNVGFNYLGHVGLRECYWLIGSMFIFGIIMEFVSMYIIMPLFNKFTKLKDKKLERKLKSLFEKYGYSTKCIYVMDGSKRSNHSNAFICGFGKRHKKIVLFDTLLKKYTPDEITAILGHELAHGKLGHLFIGRILSLICLSCTVIITIYFMYNLNMYHAFGFNWVSAENLQQYQLIGFSLFGLILSSISWIKEPFDSWISRKMEYAADKMSVKITRNSKAMISSLIKLEAENLSDPFPSKLYEMWNYDHPSLINRINAILPKKNKKNNQKKKKGN